MNSLKILLALICTAALAAGVGAADKDDNASRLVGTWSLVKSNGKPVEKGVAETFCFTKDGKFKVTKTKDGKTQSFEGIYKLVDGDTVVRMLKKKNETLTKGSETLTEASKIKTLTADTLVIGGDKGKDDDMEYKKK